MTAVEAVTRFQEEMISPNDIKACHEKAVELCVSTLKNKERPISAVKLFWFGAAGDTFPFAIDSELKMNNRIPFSKVKERFPYALFTRLPCLSRGEAFHRGDLRVGYCEIRGCNDPNQNIVKTADYLSVNRWIGIINTSDGAKIYLMPTCSVSHDLGVTQANYPQMLHAVFVKKNREYRGHGHRLPPPLSAERLRKEPSPGTSSKHQGEVGGAVGGATKRRVSFAPIPTSKSPDVGAQRVKISPQPQSDEETDSGEGVSHQGMLLVEIKKDPDRTDDGGMQPKSDTSSNESGCSAFSVGTHSPGPSELAKERDTRSPPVSETSDAGSMASSLSSSPLQLQEHQHVPGRGRGRRGRGRGRGKRGGRGRGGAAPVSMGTGEVASGDEAVGRGRGSRGRKRRGRGMRGTRGRGRGRGGAGVTEGEPGEASLVPAPKRTRLSVDIVTAEEKSARANNSVLYELLESQAASITHLQQVQIPMSSIVPRVSVLRQLSAQQRPTSQLPTIPDKDEEERGERTAGKDGITVETAHLTSTSVTMETVTTDDGGRAESESKPQPLLEEAEMKEPDLQVQEEVVSALQSDQESSDLMDVDSDPYFQPPRPPRRVSLLEYKERMKGKRKQSTEEPQHEETEVEHQKVKQKDLPQLTQGDVGTGEKVPGMGKEDTQQEKTRDNQSRSEAGAKDSSVALMMTSHVLQLQSAIHFQQQEHKGAEKTDALKHLLEKPATSTDGTKMVEPSSRIVVKPSREVAKTTSRVATSPRKVVVECHSQVVESPSKVAASPSKVTASPSKVTASPSKVTASPSKVAASPSKVTASPSQVTASPSKVTASPSKVDASLSKVAASPSKVAASPSKVTASPSKVAESPSKVAASLSKVAASPSKVAASPSKVTASPSKVAASPSKLTASPSKVEAPVGKDVEGLIEWPDEERQKRGRPVSDDVALVSDAAGELKSQKLEKEAAESGNETERDTEMEVSAKSQGEEEREQRLSGGSREKQQEETERELEKEKKGWAKKMEDQDKVWRARREKKQEREKRLARQIGKPVESWKPPSFSEPIPTHSSPFVPAQQRFNIPIHPRPHFSLGLPPPALAPQPPPPQPFLGFPHPPHPFHHQPPAPTFPPPPHPPPAPADMWSMFGSLFAQHNLFPAEEPPPPPPRTPSPLRPPAMNFGSPRRSLSPPRRASSPRLVSPTRSGSLPQSPRGGKSRSPEPAPFPSRSNLPNANPKPLDAKQFKIISELIKRTTVKKCDASVQIVPPRMISEGTQDGKGFRLRCTAVQVRARTKDSSTNTIADRPEFHHRYVQTAAVPTRNTYTQTQPAVKATGTQTTSGNASGSSLAATLERVLGTVGCTYPAIDAIVTRVEDCLLRQASLSTDTGTTSDYELVDMSCDENEVNEEGNDGVFLSPKPTALPSPVVSGASNISDGDLSDIASPSPPSDFGKSLTTDDEGNRLYSPSHPLESGEEECTEEEESQLPSPPPPPPQSLLVPSATPPPPSLPPSRVQGDLLTGEKQHSESKELEKDKHNTSDEKIENEEAFADQILEEQFSKSAVGSSKGERHVCPLLLPDDGEQGNNRATGENATAQKGKQEEETVTRQNEGCLAVTTESQQLMDCSQKSFQHSTDLETTAKEPSHVEMEEEGATESMQNTISGEDPHESSGKSEKTRIDDLPLLSPCKSSSSLPATEAATKPESPSQPKTRAKHRSASYRYEMDERTGPSVEDIAGSKSGSSSPRRSMKQSERPGKWSATSGPASSTRYKSKTDHNTESDESQSSSSRRRHKYETRHRRRSEPEGGESSGKEERRELRSRHKRGYENDSSSERSERRELRPRKGADKKEDTARGEPKKSRKTREERYKPAKSQQRDPSPYSTSGKRREKTQSKLVVPTMQAFENESSNQKSTAELSNNQELTAESNEKSGSPAIHKESSVESSETAPLSKPQSEKKRVCEAEEERGEKEGETKEDECYLRSLSLPPFKVARTSPAGSPTERSLSGSDIQSLSNRSISHSPPGSAVLKKKRPVLTKDELLAMVRAKKKSGLAKDSPNKSPSEQGSESDNGTSGERVEATERSKLDVKKLMFNFHRHMQARKGSDTSWIHPWAVSTDNTSNSPRGAVVPIPHGSTYSLKNPPPPPPGPPPSSTFQPSRPARTGSQKSLPTPVEGDAENVVCAGKSETRSPPEAMEEDEKDTTDCKDPSEESLIDSAVESAELQAAEDTLLAVFRDAVGRAVEERIQGEEIFQGRFLDTLEDKIVRENVRKFVDTAVEEKVTELMCAEDVLQERTLEAVEDTISGEVVRFALEEGVGGKVVELIRAENVLQERVLDAVESKIVYDTVAKLTDEEATKESKWLVHSEEILQEEAVKSMQKTVISEVVRKAVGEEIEKKVRETAKSEEFLQERAVSVVESQVVRETAAKALRAAVQEQVFVRIESELVEEATGAIEDVLVHECAMEVTLEREVCDLVMVEVLVWLLEETEVAVARERVCATETMVDAVVIHVEQEAGEQLVCECEETLAVGAAMEEMVDEVVATVQGDLIRVATETAAEEAVSVQIVLEMESLVSEVLDEFQSHIAFELAQAEEERTDALIENCLQALVETLLRESLSLFSEQLIADALEELEEKAIENVEEQVLQEALNEAEALNELEEKAVKNTEEQVLQEALNEAEALNELEEKAVENTEEQVLQDILQYLVDDIIAIIKNVEEQVLQEALEEKAIENVEEQVLQEALNEAEALNELEEKAIENVEEQVLQEALNEAEALNELEEKAVQNVEQQVSQDMLQYFVDDIIVVDLEIKTAEKLLEAVFSDLLGEVVEEVVDNEERVGEFMQGMIAGLVVEGMLEGTENSLANEQADKEDDIVLRAEGKISQIVVTETVDATQGRFAAKVTEEKMAEEMEDRAIDNFVSLLLADILGETAVKCVASEEDMVLEAGEVAAKRVEEEFLGEAEAVVVKEQAAVGELQEIVLNEIEEEASREEMVREMVADELEKGIMKEMEGEAAAQRAEDELKSRIAYEVTEVFPDTLATPDCTTPTTPTYVHVMDVVQDPMEHTQILYEVTEVIPDSVTQLKSENTLPHVHILDSEGETGQDLLSGSSNEQTSTYIHFIDTPPQAGELASANDTGETLDKAEQGVTLPPSEVKPKQGTQERERRQSEDSSVTSPGPSLSPPPLAVLNPLLPKYISRRLQLRPLKYFPPPDGVQRPTPLPLGSSTQTADETPPSEEEFKQDGGNLHSVSPRSKVRRRGCRSTRARRSGRRNSSGYRQPTAAERKLRPRTRSQSCSSAHDSLDPPTSPLIAPSPTQLTELVLSSIQVTDQLATSPIHPPSDAPTPARRGRPRGRPPKSSSRYRSRAGRGSRSCGKRSEDASKSPHPPREMSLIVCVPRFSMKWTSSATSEKESVSSEKEQESVTEVGPLKEVAEEAKGSTGGSTQENDDVFMEVEFSGPHALPCVQPSLESDLPAVSTDGTVATEVSPCMDMELKGVRARPASPCRPEGERKVRPPEVGTSFLDEDIEEYLQGEAPVTEAASEEAIETESTTNSEEVTASEGSSIEEMLTGARTSAEGCTSIETLTDDSCPGLTTGSLTTEDKATALGSCIGVTIECLSQHKAYASESVTADPTDSLAEDEGFPSEGCTNLRTESLSVTEDRATDTESCNNEDTASERKNGDGDLSLLDLPSTSPVNLDSPQASPATGGSFSTTTSPRSVNEEDMILRLEASFSSAPETDSDQEAELDLMIVKGTKEDDVQCESQLNAQGTKSESSSLGESGGKADRETWELCTERKVSTGDSSTTKDAIADIAEASTVSVSVATPTASLGQSEEKTGAKPLENEPVLEESGSTSVPEDTLVSEQAVIDGVLGGTNTVSVETGPSERVSHLPDAVTLVSEQAVVDSVLEGTDTVSEIVPHLSNANPPLSHLPSSSLLDKIPTTSLSPPSPPPLPPLPPLPPSPPPPPPPPATRKFNDSRRLPWATAEMLTISSEGEESMDLVSDAEGLSSSEEPVETLEERQNKTPPDHPFLVIGMNRGEETEVSKVASSPPSIPVPSSTDFTNQSESQSLLTRQTSPQPPQPREHVPSTEIPVLQMFSSHPRTLSISQHSTTESVPARSSPPSSSKNRSSPVSDAELLDLLSSAHQEFMSAPIPQGRPKPSSKAPSPSEVPANIPVAQPPVSLAPGNHGEALPFESFRETSTSTSSRETTPEASTKKAKQRSASDSLWQSFSDSKSNQPLPLSSQSHSPVVGRGGGPGILGRAPRPYHHSVPGVYPYPSRPHVYRSRNPDHLWPHIYPPSAPPQVEPPGLFPFSAHPMTPPPHYTLPHTPPPHGPYSPPHHSYPFGVLPPPHPYGHYSDQRHRYRALSRYRPPFDY